MAERKLTIRMKADTANLQRGMATASASTRTFGKSIQSGIVRHAAGIRMTGLAIAGLGAALTGVMIISIKEAMTFQKELANVSTMLDDVSMKHMPEFTDGLDRMSKEFGESTATLSKGLYDILSASIAPSKALYVLEVAAKSAAAGLTDTAVTADAITTILNSYGMAAEDAGKVSDILWATIRRGKTTMEELGPSIGKVAATAAIAGVSFEELGATIATVTRGGIRTEEAMTAILGVLRAFLKPTDDAAKAAEDFGFELNTTTLRTIGLQGVMALLTEATAEQLAAIFPNIRGLKAIAVAMQDVEGFAIDYELALNSLGLTEEMFQLQSNTLAFQLGQLKEEFMDLFEEIGTSLIPIIQSEFIPIIKDAIEYLGGWVEKFKALSPEMRKFLLVLGPILIALGGLIALLPTLAPIIAILLGPIGLIVAAIAALSAAFIYFWTTSAKFRATIKNIGEVIKVVVVNIWNYAVWLKDNWGALWATMIMGIGQIMENLRYNIWEIIKAIGVRIIGWSGWLYKNWLNAWRNLFSAIGTVAKNFGSNIWEHMKWLGEKLKPKNWLKKIEKPEWKPLFEGFEAVWEEMPKFAEIQLKSLVENVKNYMEPLPELVTPVWAAIEDGARGAADGVDELLTATEKYITTFDELRKIRKEETNEEAKRREEELEASRKLLAMLKRVEEKEKEAADKVAAAVVAAERIKRKERIKTNAERRKLLTRIVEIEKEIEDKVAAAVKVAEQIKRKEVIKTNAERRNLLIRIAQIEKENEDKVAAAVVAAERIKRKERIETNAQRRKLLIRIAQIEKQNEDKVAKGIKVAEDIKRKERIKTNKERRNLLTRIAQIEKAIEDKVAKAVKVAEELKRKEIIKTNKERRKILERIAQIEKEIANKVAKAVKVAEEIKRKERIKTNADRRKLLERIAQIEKEIEDKVAKAVKVAEEIKRKERIKTNAERRKLLTRIAEIEKATADKVVKINWDEVQEMYKNWKEFFDDVEGLSIDSLADFALYWSSLTDEQKEQLGEQYNDWEKHIEDSKKLWDDFTNDLKSDWKAVVTDWLSGITSFGEAIKSLGTVLVDNLKNKLIDIIATGFTDWLVSVTKKIWTDFIPSLGKLLTSLGGVVLKIIEWIGLSLVQVIVAVVSAIGGFIGALASLIIKLIAAVAALVIWIAKGIAAMAVAIVKWFAETIPIIGWILGIAAAALAIAAIKGLISGFGKGGVIEGYAEGGEVPPGEDMLVGVKRGEMILPKEMVDWLRDSLASPGPMSYVPSLGRATTGGQDGGGVTVNVPRGAVVIYGDVRTKMDEEEFIEKAGNRMAEKIAERLVEV